MLKPIPDFPWYSAQSQRFGLPPRCPFANVHACPRYYASLSLLGDYGSTKIEPTEDELLAAFWKESPLGPKTKEQATGISTIKEGRCCYSNFCPEVAFDRFGYFAAYLSAYEDEEASGLEHERLGQKGASIDDPGWCWSKVLPQHYAECPLYSQLSHDWHKHLVRPAMPVTNPLTSPIVRFDVFISHASEDKDAFVRPLAKELAGLGLKVWFDEWTLKLGDSIRAKIDEGLASSDYGVVVLSRAFFTKNWPQAELDGLFAREMQGRKVILPVWHDITKEEVMQFSPMLAGKLATATTEGPEAVAREIYDVLRPPSPTSSGTGSSPSGARLQKTLRRPRRLPDDPFRKYYGFYEGYHLSTSGSGNIIRAALEIRSGSIGTAIAHKKTVGGFDYHGTIRLLESILYLDLEGVHAELTRFICIAPLSQQVQVLPGVYAALSGSREPACGKMLYRKVSGWRRPAELAPDKVNLSVIAFLNQPPNPILITGLHSSTLNNLP